jgi:hypothetical protein
MNIRMYSLRSTMGMVNEGAITSEYLRVLCVCVHRPGRVIGRAPLVLTHFFDGKLAREGHGGGAFPFTESCHRFVSAPLIPFSRNTRYRSAWPGLDMILFGA